MAFSRALSKVHALEEEDPWLARFWPYPPPLMFLVDVSHVIS
jgi:hypothetical protein